MIKKKIAIALINFFIGIIIISNGFYFFSDDKDIFGVTNAVIFIVFIACLAALVMCRFSLKKTLSKKNRDSFKHPLY
jgi:amino acid transporter